VTLLSADGGRDAAVSKDGKKLLLHGLGGPLPRQALDGVVGDEIDLGA
jgi:hypothetical protein